MLILLLLLIEFYCYKATRTAALTLNRATNDFCYNVLNITSKRKLDMDGIYISMVVAVFAILKMINKFNVGYPVLKCENYRERTVSCSNCYSILLLSVLRFSAK